MSMLTLVRHGQASFFAADYDRLSDLGEKQAVLLGEHWARLGLGFDEVYTGPRVRQRQTADWIGDGLRRAGLPWPDPVVLSELDEYDLEGMFKRLAPELARQRTEFAGLVESYQGSRGHAEQVRSFQKMFEVLVLHWLESAEHHPQVESWPTFRDRVRGVLRGIMDRPGRGRRVALFTSGGFVGAATQLALGAPDRTALELSWRVRNGSLTEFVFTRDRFTLDSFNGVPHLEDPSLWTYR